LSRAARPEISEKVFPEKLNFGYNACVGKDGAVPAGGGIGPAREK
jgi:hypothetical protein